MIVMIGKFKRWQVGALGKDKKTAAILSLETEERNEQSGRVKDVIHDFFCDPGLPLGQLKPGEEVTLEVRPWVPKEGGGIIKYEFVRFLGNSRKA